MHASADPQLWTLSWLFSAGQQALIVALKYLPYFVPLKKEQSIDPNRASALMNCRTQLLSQTSVTICIYDDDLVPPIPPSPRFLLPLPFSFPSI